MQGAWLCPTCGATNRGAAALCYRCEEPQPAPTARAAAPVAPGFQAQPYSVAAAPAPAAPAAPAPAEPGYFPAWPIGYLSVPFLGLQIMFQAGLIVAAALLLQAIASGSDYLNDDWFGFVRACSVGLILAQLGSTIVHGAFLGLTAYDTPALGGGTPKFGPTRSFWWWIESGLWAWRANMSVWIPLLLGVLTAVTINILLALVVTPVLLVISLKVCGYPGVALGKPALLLEDLSLRLIPQGSNDLGLAGSWSASWGFARACDLLTPVVEVVAVLVAVVVVVSQAPRSDAGVPLVSFPNAINAAYRGVAVLLALFVIVALTASIRSLWLLTRLTLAFSNAQKVRRNAFPNGAALAVAGAYAGSIRYERPVAAASPAMAANPAAVPRPRWIRTPAEIMGEDQVAEAGPAAASAPFEPPRESTRVLLRPSSSAVPRYGIPNLGTERRREPAPGDRPEGN